MTTWTTLMFEGARCLQINKLYKRLYRNECTFYSSDYSLTSYVANKEAQNEDNERKIQSNAHSLSWSDCVKQRCHCAWLRFKNTHTLMSLPFALSGFWLSLSCNLVWWFRNVIRSVRELWWRANEHKIFWECSCFCKKLVK